MGRVDQTEVGKDSRSRATRGSNPVAPIDIAVALHSRCARIDRDRREMLHMRFSVPPEIDDTTACDLDEVPHTASGHSLPNKVQISVLISLTLSNSGFNARC